MQEKHHLKSPLQEKGLLPLVKAQKKLNICISPRMLPLESKYHPAEKRMERLEELGCQGGSGAQRTERIKPMGVVHGDNRTQTGRITNGRIHLGDNTTRNSLRREALCLTKRSHSLLQREVSKAGTGAVTQQFPGSSSIKWSPLLTFPIPTPESCLVRECAVKNNHMAKRPVPFA